MRKNVRPVQDREVRLKAVLDSIARGIADADAGRVEDAEDFLDRLEVKYRRAVDK